MKTISRLLRISTWATNIKWRLLDVRALGLIDALKLSLAQCLTILMKDFGWKPHGYRFSIHPSGLDYHLEMRAFGSDVYTIRQVLVCDEHDALMSVTDVKLIVDCGANIGCASARFLSAYPEAALVAIEPDVGNFKMLERNLAPYGKRVTLYQAAVWNEDGADLACCREIYRDGLDWSKKVERAQPGEGNTVSVTLNQALKDSGAARIDILKIDVEGAEEVIFDANCHEWLSKTRNLCIELHGRKCEDAFERALRNYSYERAQEGELVICRNLRVGTLTLIV